MAELNTPLMKSLARLFHDSGTATLKVEQQGTHRALHIANGNLIAASSNIKAERFGNLLVASRKLSSEVVEKAAVDAKANGSLLGDHLVYRGHLTLPELASLLELQVRVRFEQILLMTGEFSESPLDDVQETTRRSLGAIVLAVFRDRIPMEIVNRELLALRGQNITPQKRDGIEQLELSSLEKSFWEGLHSQKNFGAYIQDSSESQLRFMAAASVLGLLGV